MRVRGRGVRLEEACAYLLTTCTHHGRTYYSNLIPGPVHECPLIALCCSTTCAAEGVSGRPSPHPPTLMALVDAIWKPEPLCAGPRAACDRPSLPSRPCLPALDTPEQAAWQLRHCCRVHLHEHPWRTVVALHCCRFCHYADNAVERA